MKVAIVGNGRFGALLHDILKSDFDILLFDKDSDLKPLTQCDTIFLCVPIRAINSVLHDIATHIKPQATVIDTCSVKLHPVDCMKQQLPPSISIIGSHPLFGPDSYYKDSDNKIVLTNERDPQNQYPFWHDYFNKKNINVIEMSADRHDYYAAHSQGITHLLGRALNSVGIEATPIDTLGFTRLRGIIEQTCNDSLTLFEDLQAYNPYTDEALAKLVKAIDFFERDSHNKVDESSS